LTVLYGTYMAHIRQPRPDSGLGFQVKVLETFQVVPSLLGSDDSSNGLIDFAGPARKVDVRIPGKGNSNSHGARPVHLIITMRKWIRTSRLLINNFLAGPVVIHAVGGTRNPKPKPLNPFGITLTQNKSG